MSLAEEMLATMSASDESVSYLADEEPHIIIDGTRKIIVPNALKLIAVQGDKDIETVTFDCVRYWDGNDLSSFAIYINYILPNKAEGTYIPQNVTRFDDIFSFEWKIGKEITHTKGSLTFWIVAKLTNDDADVIKQWSSLQNSECTIAQGGDKTYVPESQTDKDVISQVLSVSQASALRAEEAAISAENRYELVRHLTGSVVELSGNALRDANRAEAAAEQSAVKADSSLLSAENALQSERAAMEYESRARSSAESAARAATHAEAVVAGVNEKIERNSKRITNLEQGLPSEQFMTDSTVAHVKDVPVNALPYAAVSKVGGMTRKCTNLWNHGDISSTNATEISVSYPAGTYTFSYIGNCDDSQVTKVRFVARQTDGTTRGGYLDKGKFVSHTFTAGTAIIAFWFAPTDTSGNQVNADFMVTNIMLNSGSTALPYEPYFEGLRDAKATEMKSVGVNLWSANWEQGTIGSAGGIGTSTSEIRSGFVRIFPNTTYTIKRSIIGNFIKVRFYDKDKNFIGSGDSSMYVIIRGHTYSNPLFTGQASFVATITNPHIAYMRIVDATNDLSTVYSMYLGNYSEADIPEYSPYTRNTLPIPEAVRPANGINENVYDYIEWCEDGTRKSHKRVKKMVLSGAEDWTSNVFFTRAYGFSFAPTGYKADSGMGICSHFTTASVSAALTSGAVFSSRINIVTPLDMGLSTAESFKTYLSQQYANGTPVILVYELANPEVTDISDLLSADNFLAVEGGGTVTAVNKYGYDVPSEIEYQLEV